MACEDALTVEIEHCTGCDGHQMFTRHTQSKYEEYADKDNALDSTGKIACRFRYPRLGAFEVFLRIPSSTRKIPIFSKLTCGKWPTPAAVARRVQRALQQPALLEDDGLGCSGGEVSPLVSKLVKSQPSSPTSAVPGLPLSVGSAAEKAEQSNSASGDVVQLPSVPIQNASVAAVETPEEIMGISAAAEKSTHLEGLEAARKADVEEPVLESAKLSSSGSAAKPKKKHKSKQKERITGENAVPAEREEGFEQPCASLPADKPKKHHKAKHDSKGNEGQPQEKEHSGSVNGGSQEALEKNAQEFRSHKKEGEIEKKNLTSVDSENTQMESAAKKQHEQRGGSKKSDTEKEKAPLIKASSGQETKKEENFIYEVEKATAMGGDYQESPDRKKKKKEEAEMEARVRQREEEGAASEVKKQHKDEVSRKTASPVQQGMPCDIDNSERKQRPENGGLEAAAKEDDKKTTTTDTRQLLTFSTHPAAPVTRQYELTLPVGAKQTQVYGFLGKLSAAQAMASDELEADFGAPDNCVLFLHFLVQQASITRTSVAL
ncbi:hypothetical protein cyc_01636 [Cyclospora cayetanensis]|uniref:Uncharacterized protein n=1 Tax=Cyclospora cayetanensis TaxID=88456 RepID=A0A1D3D236_9EIME|nr:hypothetical protein cyc_01636 [Cyclospora cayetanensis]